MHCLGPTRLFSIVVGKMLRIFALLSEPGPACSVKISVFLGIIRRHCALLAGICERSKLWQKFCFEEALRKLANRVDKRHGIADEYLDALLCAQQLVALKYKTWKIFENLF